MPRPWGMWAALALGVGACGRADGPRSEGSAPAATESPSAVTVPTTQPQPSRSPASFAVWHLKDAPQDFEVLREMLSQGGGTVDSAPTYAEWVKSSADVLVLRGSDESGMLLGPDALMDGLTLEPLKGRRVVGIGGEAARLFGRLGLELRDGKTATFPRSKASVVLQPSALLPPETSGTWVVVFDGSREWECEGLFLPGAEHLGPVEVLARWAGDRQYAAIARQQNYVLSALPADAASWTTDFRRTFQAAMFALAGRPVEPFTLAEWAVSPRGTHVVEMRRSLFGSDHRRTFRFRFDEPVLFTAELEVERGDAVTLLFLAEQSGDDNVREDGKAGDTLRIASAITAGDVRRNQGRYWSLSVSNFGLSSVRAALRVDWSKDATLRLADGSTLRVTDPPRDSGTIERLIALMFDPDPSVGMRAAAALEFVGASALPALEAAKRALRWPGDRARILRLSMLAGRIEEEGGDD